MTLTLALWCKRSNKNREKMWFIQRYNDDVFNDWCAQINRAAFQAKRKWLHYQLLSALRRWVMISISNIWSRTDESWFLNPSCTHTTHTTRISWHSGVRLNIVLELIIISRNKLGCWIEWFWMENKRQRLIYSAIAEFAVESARNSILQYQTRFGLHKHTSGSVQENSIPCSAF